MLKNMNGFAIKEKGSIATGALAVAMTLIVVTFRYVMYFL